MGYRVESLKFQQEIVKILQIEKEYSLQNYKWIWNAITFLDEIKKNSSQECHG